jgi:molecular chaperone Hsp33
VTRDVADTLTRFVFEGAAVRGAAVTLAATSRAILAAHPYPPALARVLGELLAAAALLAASLKFEGQLVVQLSGDGPVPLLVVECDHTLALRATAQWHADLVAALPATAPLAALAGGPARSRLAITLAPSDGPLYQGIVALEGGSVAQIIEHYLERSEQLASRLVLAARGDEAAGLLVQRLPGSGPADEATWERACARIAATTAGELLAGADPHLALMTRFPEDDLRAFAPAAPRFACRCSRERVEAALRIAGAAEIEAALAERGEVEVVCEFCGEHYVYEPGAARALFAPAAGAPEARQ